MTLIHISPSRRVKVDGNVWRFANASSIAWDALSLSLLNFDMLVTGYCLIIVPSGPRPVGRPCLVSLPLLFFRCWCHVSFTWYRFREAGVTVTCRSSVGRAILPFAEGHRCCFILAAFAGVRLTFFSLLVPRFF